MALGKGGGGPDFGMWQVPLKWGHWKRSGGETEFVWDVFKLLIGCPRGCVQLRVALRLEFGRDVLADGTDLESPKSVPSWSLEPGEQMVSFPACLQSEKGPAAQHQILGNASVRLSLSMTWVRRNSVYPIWEDMLLSFEEDGGTGSVDAAGIVGSCGDHTVMVSLL